MPSPRSRICLPRRPRLLTHASLCLAVLSVVVLGGGTLTRPTVAAADAASVTTSPSYDALVDGLADTSRAVLAAYMAKDGPADTRFYSDGLWMDPAVECWTCFSTAASAAAILSREGDGDPVLEAAAIRTYDRAIADHQNADGSFSGTTSGPGVDTAFWMGEFGRGYLVLADRLDQATRLRWETSLGRAADYLINAGHTKWYANGNLNLRYAEVLYMAWKATGKARFKEAYEEEWSFVLAPPQQRWLGFGLQIVDQPTTASGSDGAGYLAEAGGGAPGYDPAYTQAQLDIATGLYMISRDPRALRLMNLEANQLLKRVDSSWTLDARDGSRKSYITPFMTAALAVLVRSGERPDFAGLIQGQFARTTREFRGAMTYTHPNFYKGLSGWLALPVLDRQMGAAQVAGPEETPAQSTVASTPVTAPSAPSTATALPARATGVAAKVTSTPRLQPAAVAHVPAPAWSIAKLRRDRRTVTISVRGVNGASRVRAELFKSARDAADAAAKPLRKIVRRHRHARFVVRVPAGSVWRRDAVMLRLTITDAYGARTVLRRVTISRG